MLIKSMMQRAKSLAESFSKPQTYGSALEYYIISKQPIDSADVDRLTREFESKKSQQWGFLA